MTARATGRVSFRAAVGMVAGRELRQRVRDRSFYVSTAIMLAVIVAVIVFPRMLSFGTDSYDIGIVDDNAGLGSSALQQADTDAIDLKNTYYYTSISHTSPHT